MENKKEKMDELVLPMSYAEMSYLRDLIAQDKHLRTEKLLKDSNLRNANSTTITQKIEEYWAKQRRDPPITAQACIMLLIERLDELEDKYRKALGLEN